MPAMEPPPVRAAHAGKAGSCAGFDVNHLPWEDGSPRGDVPERKPRCADACRVH